MELLVVIAIIGLLVSLLLPAISAAREAARRTSCKNNLRQLGVAMHNYEQARKALPASGLVRPPKFANGNVVYDATSGKMFSWVVQLLPFMEEQNLHNRFDFNKTVMQQTAEPQATHLPVLECPSDAAGDRFFSHPTYTKGKRFAKGNYAAYASPYHVELQNFFPGALIAGRRQGFKQILDGTSKTLMLAEIRTRDKQSDQRGAWALPWTGASLLAFDAHTDPDYVPIDGQENVRYQFNSWSLGQTQPPNGQGPNIDTLYDCSESAAAQFDYMPCVEMTFQPILSTFDVIFSAYFSAAPRSQHAEGVNVVFVDGHVDFITDAINEITMAYLISIDDGQIMAGY